MEGLGRLLELLEEVFICDIYDSRNVTVHGLKRLDQWETFDFRNIAKCKFKHDVMVRISVGTPRRGANAKHLGSVLKRELPICRVQCQRWALHWYLLPGNFHLHFEDEVLVRRANYEHKAVLVGDVQRM